MIDGHTTIHLLTLGLTASCAGLSKLAANLQNVAIDSSTAQALHGTSEAFLRLAYLAFFSDWCACSLGL